MNSEFPAARLLLAFLIAIAVHTGLPGNEQGIDAAGPPDSQRAATTADLALHQWQSTGSELGLLYLSHPHVNPLEQQTLLEYSWQARAQIVNLRESLHAIAYLLRSDKNGQKQFTQAVQILTRSARSISTNSSN